MRYQRFIEVYGVCEDRDGRTLLVSVHPDEGHAPTWSLPGGRVEHGEHPVEALVGLVVAQTGYPVEVVGARDVLTETDKAARGRRISHHDRIVLDVHLAGAAQPPPPGVSVAWLAPEDVAGAALTPTAARALGHGVPPEDRSARRISWAKVRGEADDRRQRFAAYGLATDPDGNVLLTLISEGYPGAGRWHLPGGGTDFGESAAAGLAREIVEETGQLGAIIELINVSHRHTRDARGPEGRPMDWHGVRVVYRVRVASPSSPEVLDRGGSTAAAAWYSPQDALDLPLTEIAHDMIAEHLLLDPPARS